VATFQQQYPDDNNIIKVTNVLSVPQIKFDCKEKVDLYVLADNIRLTQVIYNLLTNAIESIESSRRGGSSISVIVKSGDNEIGKKYAFVSVKDDGQGVDADMFPKLFSKFATNSEKGTGLGLFISKSIIDAHSGKMWAENNPGGTGATFTFTLPLLDQQAE
jgi:two-component system, OmpR family, sensor histidine kinase VicK